MLQGDRCTVVDAKRTGRGIVLQACVIGEHRTGKLRQRVVQHPHAVHNHEVIVGGIAVGGVEDVVEVPAECTRPRYGITTDHRCR